MAANTVVESNRIDGLMDVVAKLEKSHFADDEKGELDENEADVELINGSKLPSDCVAAQTFAYFGASFESASTAIGFTLYELSVNPKVQSRLQEEIDLMVEDNPTTVAYNTIERMPYLNRVVSETLKKYPLLPSLQQECSRRSPSDFLQKRIGQLLGLQEHSYAENVKAEWFSEERRPYNFVQYGEGQPMCFGMRIVLLQIKIGLVNILSRFSVRREQIITSKVKFNSHSSLLLSSTGFQIKFEERHWAKFTNHYSQEIV